MWLFPRLIKCVMPVKHMGTLFTLVTNLQDCVIIQSPYEGWLSVADTGSSSSSALVPCYLLTYSLGSSHMGLLSLLWTSHALSHSRPCLCSSFCLGCCFPGNEWHTHSHLVGLTLKVTLLGFSIHIPSSSKWISITSLPLALLDGLCYFMVRGCCPYWKVNLITVTLWVSLKILS